MCLESRKKKEKGADGFLIFLVLLLVVCGLIFLYSTSAYNGRVKFHDSAYYFKKQLFATSLGLMGMYLVSFMDYHFLVKMAPFFYVVSLALSLAVLLFGEEYNGSKRWLSLGPLSFQPSEFSKVTVILLLAWVITRGKEENRGILYMAGRMAILLPVVGLVGTNNLSTAVIILGIGVILIFVSNPRYLPFVGIGAAGIVFIAIFLGMASYRLERLAIWRNPGSVFHSSPSPMFHLYINLHKVPSHFPQRHMLIGKTGVWLHSEGSRHSRTISVSLVLHGAYYSLSHRLPRTE